MKRLLLALAITASASLHSPLLSAANPVWQENKTEAEYSIDVYHSPTCGCCKAWIEHLEDHNFKVNSIEMHDVSPIKQRLGVPPQGASCHTAVVNGLVVEGHVPAQDIKTLLDKSDSNIRLLTVPGMPSGGPGMDHEGARKDDFEVFAVSKDNKVSTYNHYKDY
ncbi:DUF411 domain-containing protein [Neptuniibacter sp.]|uniref:DUF411 domain-containing protein n=1 Tax=Neptuniibacter sp. TaxID=1962643 RepID=UPI002627EC75|nr:DUF411 domain-containing protein [Neptuniibacter sp.]MCP4596756.1 DUF411 domain-containing protein [Neptuniibacter sp.]